MQSQTDLAIHYINGTGVEEDVFRAVELYRLAAEQGDTWAQHLLGVCYREVTVSAKIFAWLLRGGKKLRRNIQKLESNLRNLINRPPNRAA